MNNLIEDLKKKVERLNSETREIDEESGEVEQKESEELQKIRTVVERLESSKIDQRVIKSELNDIERCVNLFLTISNALYQESMHLNKASREAKDIAQEGEKVFKGLENGSMTVDSGKDISYYSYSCRKVEENLSMIEDEREKAADEVDNLEKLGERLLEILNKCRENSSDKNREQLENLEREVREVFSGSGQIAKTRTNLRNSKKQERDMGRRDFLKAGASAATVIGLSGCSGARSIAERQLSKGRSIAEERAKKELPEEIPLPDQLGKDSKIKLNLPTEAIDPKKNQNSNLSNPWSKGKVIVGIRQPERDIKDLGTLLRRACDFWERNDTEYLGYEISFSIDPDVSNPDIAVKVVNKIEGCGQVSGDEIAGCAPVNRNGRAPETSEVRIESGYQKDITQLLLKHELGHTLGLTHSDPPKGVMAERIEDRITHYDVKREILVFYNKGVEGYNTGISLYSKGRSLLQEEKLEQARENLESSIKDFESSEKYFEKAINLSKQLGNNKVVNLLQGAKKKSSKMRKAVSKLESAVNQYLKNKDSNGEGLYNTYREEFAEAQSIKAPRGDEITGLLGITTD